MNQNLKLALNYSSVKCSNLMDLWILQDFFMQFLVKVNLFNSRNLLSTVGIGKEIGSQRFAQRNQAGQLTHKT